MNKSTLLLSLKIKLVQTHMADDKQDEHTIASYIQDIMYVFCLPFNFRVCCSNSLPLMVQPRRGLQKNLVSWDTLAYNTCISKSTLLCIPVHTCLYSTSTT